MVGKFATGSIQHELVTGFNLTRTNDTTTNNDRQIAALDLFNPVYGNQPFGDVDADQNFQTSDTLVFMFKIR